MHHSTTVKQEPSAVLDLVSLFGRFAFNSRFPNLGSDRCSSVLSNSLYFGSVGSTVVDKKHKAAVTSLSLGSRKVFSFRKFFNEFNRAVRLHCEKIPIGFASVGVGCGNDSGNGLSEDGCGVLEDGRVHSNGVGAENPKKVLILMSDTGGGHRASAEAIKAAFYEEFGDDYQVSLYA